MDLPSDPDSLAMLLVQQFLEEQGCTPALKEVERQYGLKYVPEKLPRGSMLLELVYQHLEQAAAEAAADEDEARISAETEEEALLKGGRPEFAVEHVACVQNLHSANIISICCWPGAPKFISGSGNGQVQLITFDGDLLWTQKLAGGGILSLDLHVDEREGRSYLLVGSMDGTVTVMDAQEGIVLASSKAHTKYCVRVIWGPSASTFVSASWDQSLVVHRWTPPLEGQAASIGELHREQYATAVTDAALLADQTTLVVSLRNTNFLRLFSTETQKGVGTVNMNAQGDNHVSFTASHLAVSPCGKYILVSTDGARIIMFNVADWHQSRNFFGLQIESFHQPLTTWHPSGFYFFAAAAHGQVMVFHVGSAKVVATLKAHEKNVRSLHYDKQQRCLVTGSFDRNVQIYKDAICMPALLATPAEDISLETKTQQP